METSKFASLWARVYVREQTQKRLFGKPYIKYGPLLTICGFLFQQSGLLGRAFRSTPEPFVTAFCAAKGQSEEMPAFMREEVSRRILPYLYRGYTISKLVMAFEMDTMGELGDPHVWFLKHSMERLQVDAAVALAWIWQLSGAGFGMQHPDRFEELFNSSYKKQDAESWHTAYELGVWTLLKSPTLLSRRLSVRLLKSSRNTARNSTHGC